MANDSDTRSVPEGVLLTDFGNLRDPFERHTFMHYLRGRNFFHEPILWGVPWMDFEQQYLKHNRFTLRYKHESVRFREMHLKIKTHMYPTEGYEHGDNYLAKEPDTTEWHKVEHQCRAAMRLWDLNRRLPGGLYYVSEEDAKEHSEKLEPSKDLHVFQTYIDASECQLEQMTRVLMHKRDDWIEANPYAKTEFKSDVPKKEIIVPEKNPIEERLGNIETLPNDYGGQLDVLRQWVGSKKSRAESFNQVSKLTLEDFRKMIARRFKLTWEEQGDAVIQIQEDFQDVELRFRKPADQITVDNVLHQVHFLNETTWAPIIRRAKASKHPLILRIKSPAPKMKALPATHKRKGDDAVKTATSAKVGSRGLIAEDDEEKPTEAAGDDEQRPRKKRRFDSSDSKADLGRQITMARRKHSSRIFPLLRSKAGDALRQDADMEKQAGGSSRDVAQIVMTMAQKLDLVGAAGAFGIQAGKE